MALFTVEDLREPYRLERVLQQFNAQFQELTNKTERIERLARTEPTTPTPAASNGAIPGTPVPGTPVGGTVVNALNPLTNHAIILGDSTSPNIKSGTLGTTTTVLHGNAAGDPTYGSVSLTGDVSGVLPAANGGTAVSYDRIAAVVALTAQTADIGSTNFANSGTGSQFLICYYLETTTADGTAGTVTVTFAFTDAAGATTVVSTAVNLAAADRQSGVFAVQRASGNIAYSTGHTGIYGTSQYALYATLQRFS